MTFSSFQETSHPSFKLLKVMNVYEINLYLKLQTSCIVTLLWQTS